jgi:hypothetical protein
MEDEEEDERHRIFPMREYLEYKMEYAWTNSFFRSIYGKISR